MSSLDTTAEFGAPSFDAKQWLNASLAADAASTEPVDMRLSVLLTKLQLRAADVDAAVDESSAALAAAAPQVARDVGLVREQASAVRTEVLALVGEVSAVEASSEASVALLREVLRVRQRMERAGEMLVQAERVTRQLEAAEAAYARHDHAAAAGGVGELSAGIAALSDGARALFPDAEARAAAVRGGLLERLRPLLLDAVASHAADATAQHVGVYRELGRESDARAAYAECRQGPLFEAWNARDRGKPGGAQLAAFLATVEASAAAELAFLGRAWPSLGRAAAAALAADVVAGALEALRGALEAAVAGLEGDPAALGDACAAGRAAAARLRGALEAVDSDAGAQAAAGAGARRAAEAVVACFEAAEAKYATLLWPALEAELAPLLPPPPAADADAGDALEAVAAAAERAAAPVSAAVGAALKRAAAVGGAAGMGATARLVERGFGRYADALIAALDGVLAAFAAPLLLPEDDARTRGALRMLQAAVALQTAADALEVAFRAAARREATAALAPEALVTAAQRAAAEAALNGIEGDDSGEPQLGGVGIPARAVLVRSQRLALAALTAGVTSQLAAIGTKESRDVWRGAAADGMSAGQVAEAEELSAALLAFSPSPLAYVTAAGEQMLSIPRLLEPFTASDALTRLHHSLRVGAGDGDDDDDDDDDAGGGAIEWLRAIGATIVGRLIELVREIPAFSPLGAKQLAADVGYLGNVLCAGLGLPPSDDLAELERLLTCAPAELPAAVRADASRLPDGFAAAIAAKRGVQV